ncbi:MAG: 50S ribosomal protein L11 methyltransferase [Chloroflexi bacterium]|nr:50S ribosomal protein L11 methyltransferase [Chloroflexota bacterium]
MSNSESKPVNGNPEWLELAIQTNSELAEAISEAIYPYVEGGVATEQMNTNGKAVDRWEDEIATGPVIVRGYLPMDGTQEERRQKVEYALRCLNLVMPVPMPTYRSIAQADWAESWKAAFKPLRIGRNILVHPSWVDINPQPDDVVISLDPGLAFGTGLHPTTQLCGGAIESLVTAGMRVLDVGSGSALLSIIAAKLGACEVLGVDIDDEAVRVGRENASKNEVERIVHIESGSFERASGIYDLVIANILAGVIVKMLGNGLSRLGKWFIFSGILETQVPQVSDAITQSGLEVIEHNQITDWVCLVCRAR